LTAKGLTVLVVEDEYTLRVAVSKALRREDFSVIEAADGTIAINLVREHTGQIDLMLLDMTIPGTSSQEVFLEARRLRPNIKIILVTAYSRDMAIQSFDLTQVAGFVRKPYRLRELTELLRRVLCG
jgi:two-component system cell cycle sensor histidine kinase/response regulator CckA